MSVEAEQLLTQVRPKNALGKVVQFPLVRAVMALLFLAPFLVFHNTVIGDLLASLGEPLKSYIGYLDTAVSVLILILLYRLYTRWVEKRDAVEMGTHGLLVELGAGFLVALAVVGLMVLAMGALGYYKVELTESGKTILDGWFLFGMGAFLQVLVFRIIFFRLLEAWLGSWVALVMVSFAFGLAHLGNPAATAWSALALVLSDVLLIGAFIYTRRLWLTWGIHWGWNFFQDGIFGMPNSGITDLPSWIHPVVEGPEWVTGGDFGIEASVVAVLLSFAVGVFLLKRAIGKGQILTPSWRRRETASLGEAVDELRPSE